MTRQVRALVIKTGYHTTKGQLVRYILFPKPTKFKFYSDAFKFLGVLFVICEFRRFQVIDIASIDWICIFNISVCLIWGKTGYINECPQADPLEIVLRGLDLFTIVIPPALPIALTSAQFFALRRLRLQQSIYCISPPRYSFFLKSSQWENLWSRQSRYHVFR